MNKYQEVKNAFVKDTVIIGQAVCGDSETVEPFDKARKNARVSGISLHNGLTPGEQICILKQGLIEWSSDEDIPIGQTMFIDNIGFPTWRKTNFVYGIVKEKSRGIYSIKVDFL